MAVLACGLAAIALLVGSPTALVAQQTPDETQADESSDQPVTPADYSVEPVEPSEPSEPAPADQAPAPAAPAPAPAPASRRGGSAQLTPGALTLSATFNSIGLEVKFSGDANANATAGLEFKKSGDGGWRQGLPLWRTDDGSANPGAAFYGSALELDPGTSYDVRVSLSDPDGVAGTNVLTGSVTTRAEDIPDPAALAPGYFVSLDGSDANDGASPTTAWRTLDKAVKAAPPGAVVELAPGHYAAPSRRTVRNTPLTLKARNPAAVAAPQSVGGEMRTVVSEANGGARSVVEPPGSDGAPAVSAPGGAQDPDLTGAAINRIAPWQQVTFQGVNDPSQHYTVWKWAGSPVAKAVQMGYAPTRDAQPLRVANWYTAGTPSIDTPQKWAELVYTHPDWRSGFYASDKEGVHFLNENGQDATTNTNDIYLRLPDDSNPNDSYVTVNGEGAQAGLIIDGPDVRVSGLEFRIVARGLDVRTGAARAVIDQCLFVVGNTGIWVSGTKGSKTAPAQYGSDHVVQHNLFLDSGIWSLDPAHPAIPWYFIKKPVHLAAYSETAGIAGTGGARRMVIRSNTFDGTFDGIGGYHPGFDRYSMQDADVYDNLFRHHTDDPLDIAYGTINYRIWGNRFEQSTTVLSTADTTYGPLYFFRNVAWHTGNAHTGRNGAERAVGTTMFKFGGKSRPASRVYVLQNTLWTDEVGWSPTYGGAQWGSSGSEPERFFLRNNIIRVTGKAFEVPTVAGSWDEDYDDFSSDDPQHKSELLGKYRSDLQAYRSQSGQGAHTNTRGGLVAVPDAELMDPGNGDLRLKPGSSFVDRGVPLPNLSDRPGVDVLGSAPDLGAIEQG